MAQKNGQRSVSPNDILRWCLAQGLEVSLVEHPPVGQTSQEASRVLGVPSQSIIKSLLLQANPGGQVGAIQQAAHRVDLSRVMTALGIGKPALVPAGIVTRVLKTEPGTVSPFSFAMNGLRAVVESKVFETTQVFATAGSPTHSLVFSPSILTRIGYEIANLAEAD